MAEKIIYLTEINPISLYGINDVNVGILKQYFSKTKIIARGNKLKIIGNDLEIEKFEEKVNLIIRFLEKYNKLSKEDIEFILNNDNSSVNKTINRPEFNIIFGINGKPINARTDTQQLMVEEFMKNDLIFAIGPAGTGKTYMAIALAVRALKNKQVKRIILSRPAVEAGEHLGFLPGDLKEKLDPYLQALYDALYDMIAPKKLDDFIEEKIIQIAPLAFMRGRTLNNAIVILDEAQNTSTNQLKMFLTRMGENAKFIVTGDITQIDLPDKNKSGLLQSRKILKNIEGISIIEFSSQDIVRHKLVKRIVAAYEEL